jgi:succinate-semialdehyde dehydrogenase/glutarate-semialdehyde dehydrogenase
MATKFELSDLIRTEHFIDGQWVASIDGERFDVTNPATAEVIATIADGGEADARAAVDAAARAFPAGARRCRKSVRTCCTAGTR